MPSGVHGKRPGSPSSSLPALSGPTPSTSLAGSIADAIAFAEIAFGSGSWTRMPSTPSSRFSFAIRARRSASRVSAESLCSTEPMPTRSHARRLPLMYEALAASSPTSTTARQGARRPAPTRAATSLAMRSRSSWASASPSTTTVAMDDTLFAPPVSRTRGAYPSGGGLRPLALAAALLRALARRVAAAVGLALAGCGSRRLGRLGVGLRGVVALHRRLGGVEVVVPAAALQHERSARDLPLRLQRAAARALLHRRVADALLALELVAAAFAEVFVDRHRLPRAGWVPNPPGSASVSNAVSLRAQDPFGRVR